MTSTPTTGTAASTPIVAIGGGVLNPADPTAERSPAERTATTDPLPRPSACHGTRLAERPTTHPLCFTRSTRATGCVVPT